MKIRGLFLMFLSLVLGLVAVTFLNGLGRTVPPPPAKIVSAKTALNFGAHLTADNLKLVDFPPGTKLEGAFSTIEELTGDSEDRVVLRPIAADEPILAAKISGAGGKATLSTVVEKDMRAMTIRVNDVTGGGGFVLPHDRVDVLLTRNDATEKETIILLRNIKVLGVDQQADQSKDKPIVAKAVTLEVSPEDAQKLTLGGSVGSLSLALRNYANPDAGPAGGVLSVADLFSPGAHVKKTAAAAPRPKIEILRGTDATSYDLNGDGTVREAERDPLHPRPFAPRPATAAIR